VPLKNYYELLEIAAGAPIDEVKKAFRLQIARYHPDKVQHLGREFQSMAADRAAELTEAYRILSDEGRRAEYDRAVADAGGLPTSAAAAPRPSPSAASPPPSADQAAPPPAPPPSSTERQTGPQFKQERASRDEFVRKATMSRLRQALAAVGGGYDESEVPGFDLACVPKKKMFASNKNPRLLGRFISRLDREAVADAWKEAAKWGVPGGDEVCVLLMGTSLAPAGELAGEIADQRKRQPRKGGKLTLIPVDARVWDAHMPFDAPAIAKTLLARLRTGS
jgi:curved DNA-binding protein CbpA